MARPTPPPRWHTKYYFSPLPKNRGGYLVKGVSAPIWKDEQSSSDSSTRQRLKRELRREMEALR
jgi:hypothetical protein